MIDLRRRHILITGGSRGIGAACARMFAKAILRSRKFGKIFNEADEEELETLYEQIAGQLDGSPVLAQLDDDMTEGARKINLG